MINLIAMTRHEANVRRTIRERNGGQEVPFYAHPGMYATRAVKQPDGSMRLIEDIPSVEALKAHGAQVINTTERQSLLDDMFYVSGEIPRVTAFEHGLPTQHRQTSNGGWEPDPLVMDERWVAANVKDKDIVVFTACSHAGVVNVLKHAQDCFPDVPLHAVIGGFHLSGGNEKVIPETVEGLRALDLKTIAAAHCIGWRAIMALTQAFGEPVVAPSAVGKRYTFS